MVGIGELAHIDADLRQQILRRLAPDAGDGVQEDQQVLVGRQALSNLRTQVGDQGVQVIDTGEHAGQQPAVMGVHGPGQGRLQHRDLGLHAATRTLG